MSLNEGLAPAVPKKGKPKQLIMVVTFENEKDLRNSVKYFVDSVEGGVKYLTQDVSVGNKLEGGATLDWNVSTDWSNEVEF